MGVWMHVYGWSNTIRCCNEGIQSGLSGLSLPWQVRSPATESPEWPPQTEWWKEGSQLFLSDHLPSKRKKYNREHVRKRHFFVWLPLPPKHIHILCTSYLPFSPVLSNRPLWDVLSNWVMWQAGLLQSQFSNQSRLTSDKSTHSWMVHWVSYNIIDVALQRLWMCVLCSFLSESVPLFITPQALLFLLHWSLLWRRVMQN